jgi:excisionase family DNA binding protein
VSESRRWLKIAEVADRLGLSVKSCYRLAAQGKFPVGRIGRTLRIDWLAVEAKLETQAKGEEK